MQGSWKWKKALYDSSPMFKAIIYYEEFVLQKATDDTLQDSNLGTTMDCHFKEIPAPPTPGSVIMMMTTAMNT